MLEDRKSVFASRKFSTAPRVRYISPNIMILLAGKRMNRVLMVADTSDKMSLDFDASKMSLDFDVLEYNLTLQEIFQALRCSSG
ncbi:hypothetical protein J6590_065725 [Homalodisca vitripennis]|nr:hypothetical protein J6590_065725 [Homalodisca vitripennis]